MTDVTVAHHDSRQAPSRDRPKGLKVTPKVATAIEAMVWQGKPIDEAAKEAGLTTRAMRLALGKPHVLAMLRAEKLVLQASHGPRNIHRLAEIRDAGNNMPAVQAIGMLERMSDETSMRSTSQAATPGVCINIITHAQSTPERVVEAKQLITLASDVLPENIRATDE